MMNIDEIKDKGITITVGTWISSILITVSLTTIYWNMRTLEGRMDKRYHRIEKQIEIIDNQLKELDKCPN